MLEAEQAAEAAAALVHAIPWVERAAGAAALQLGDGGFGARAAWGRAGLGCDLSAAILRIAHPAVPAHRQQAGMFEPPPPDQFATATLAGLALNNLSTLLFMVPAARAGGWWRLRWRGRRRRAAVPADSHSQS